jgi:hypothetical protein
MLDGPQIRSGSLSRREESFASAGIRTLDCPASNYPVVYVVSIPTGYPSSTEHRQKTNIRVNKWRRMNGQTGSKCELEAQKWVGWWYVNKRTDRFGRSEAFATVLLRSSLFRVVAQRSLICCRRFGQSCRFHLKQLRRPRRYLNPWRGDRYNWPKRR